jgi:hypothetical protein
MSIQEIVLHATNRPPVAFQGRIAAQAVGPTDDPRLLGRHHAITVYVTESGELHLVFEFKSECEHEKRRCDVELGIQSDEIPEVLLAYDATEYLDRTRLKNRYEREIMQFMKRLHHQYDDLCASIERQMLNYQPQVPVGSQHDGGDVDEVKPSGWRSWLPFSKPR